MTTLYDDETKELFSNPTNLELLRLAKELAYSDYNNRKAELHNQWLAESDLAWKKHRLKVTYPEIPSFPTEAEIVSRATKLIEFLNTPRPDLVKPKEEEIQEAVTAGEPIEQAVTEPTASIETPISVTPEPTTVEPTTAEPVVEKATLPPEQDLEYAKYKIHKKLDGGANRDLAGALMQKLNDIKLTWKK